ncbi:MAG TPA: GFA family protein [Stellaceae bacterium]|nr:GFA family protein [Stellaceae bacterium]
MSAVRGSCLCGGVKYEIVGPLMRPLNCHCSLCRKQQGAAFRSRARVRRNDFKWLQGEELVTYYEATPGYRRGFCRVCGSPIINRAEPDSRLAESHPQTLMEFGVALGTLDDDPGVRPESHIFVGSKAPWFEITDDLPQFAEYPPAG